MKEKDLRVNEGPPTGYADRLEQTVGQKVKIVRNLIADIRRWFVVAVPNPDPLRAQKQIGCHFEEVAEMAEIICDGEEELPEYLQQVGQYYKSRDSVVIPDLTFEDKKALLDSLADQIVTAIGVAHFYNFDLEGALRAVNEANWQKFPNGEALFDENGKIKKPEGWKPADLTPFV